MSPLISPAVTSYRLSPFSQCSNLSRHGQTDRWTELD